MEQLAQMVRDLLARGIHPDFIRSRVVVAIAEYQREQAIEAKQRGEPAQADDDTIPF